MIININQIPAQGLSLREEVSAATLDLDTDIVKVCSPVGVRAEIIKFTNTVTAEINLDTSLTVNCSRCLNKFKIKLTKDLRLSYPLDGYQSTVDLGPDIRQEIILDYPLKPLCNSECKGLCPQCGKNLNEGECACKFK